MSDVVATPPPEPGAGATVALLTPIANAKVVAAICALNSCPADVLEISAGTFAVMDSHEEGSADRAAAAVSTLIRGNPLLAMERRDGQLTITRWLDGVRGEEVPPGLALDQAPPIIVSIMTGMTTVDDVRKREPGRVHSGRMGRFTAFRALRRLAKQARRATRADRIDQ